MLSHSLSKSGGVVEIAHLISDVTSKVDRYRDLMHTSALNPASHKYVVANGTNSVMARVESAGYSFLTLNQNSERVSCAYVPCSCLSQEISINCSISAAGKSTVSGLHWKGFCSQSYLDISKSGEKGRKLSIQSAEMLSNNLCGRLDIVIVGQELAKVRERFIV